MDINTIFSIPYFLPSRNKFTADPRACPCEGVSEQYAPPHTYMHQVCLITVFKGMETKGASSRAIP